jgi:tRNA (guanine37-N1)-methyltransferase
MTDRIALGIIRKPHGVRGEASVEVWSDVPDRFDDLSRVTLVSPDEKSTRDVTVESTRLHAGRALVKFAGIQSPEELRALQGWTIEIPESEARPLDRDEYFLHDLVGLTLVDEAGRERGKVTAAFEGGGGVLLTVKNGPRQYDVPFAAAICKQVDLGGKRIVVDLPDGLEDLDNIPATDDPAQESGDEKAEAESETPASENSHRPTAASPGAKLRIDFVTIFPRMFEPLLAEGVIARGVKQGLLDVRAWDLRDYATDKHRSTDDEAYGGGPGMVMLAEPVVRCIEAIRGQRDVESRVIPLPPGESGTTRSGAPDEGPASAHLVMTTPQGRRFTQQIARDLAGDGWVIFLCGRYEGFDHRVHEILQPDEISVGDFVVSGGELPAMIIADAVGRMIEGVVGNSGSVEEDSFFRGLLDYPHYTRPEELRGMRVPDILLSGHHEKIRRWRRERALRATLEKRPDLIQAAELDDEARQILAEIAPDSSWAKEADAKREDEARKR